MLDAPHVPSVPVVQVNDVTAVLLLRIQPTVTSAEDTFASPTPVDTVAFGMNTGSNSPVVPTVLEMAGIAIYPVTVGTLDI